MDDGETPEEIKLSNAFRRFGAFNVLGRPMSALEIQRIGTAENVVNICRERGASENKAEWATENPEAAEVFNYAMKLALDMGLVKDPD